MTVLVERDAYTARLLCQRLEYGLAHPPHGVGDELHTLFRIELLHRLEEPLIADGHELREIEAVPLILLHVRDHEPEVGSDQALGGLCITLARTPREAPFLGGIWNQREFLNVLEVLIESTR